MYISIYLQKNDPIGRYLLSIPAHYRSASFCVKVEQYLSGLPLEWPVGIFQQKEPKELRIYIPIRQDLFPNVNQYINFLLEKGIRHPGTHLRDLAYGLKAAGWEGASKSVDPIIKFIETPKRAGRPRNRSTLKEQHVQKNDFLKEPREEDKGAELTEPHSFMDARDILKERQSI